MAVSIKPRPRRSPSEALRALFGEARALQHRRRRRYLLALLLACAAAACAAYLAIRPSGGAPRASAGTVLKGADLVLRGHRAFQVKVHAPAGVAYDVRFTAPAASRAVVTMRIAPGTGWRFSTRDDPPCRTSAGQTKCLLHFAAGGNLGGTWSADVRNTTGSTATLHLVVAFFKPARSATS